MKKFACILVVFIVASTFVFAYDAVPCGDTEYVEAYYIERHIIGGLTRICMVTGQQSRTPAFLMLECGERIPYQMELCETTEQRIQFLRTLRVY